MATFTIGATVASFHATVVSSQDEAGDLERLQLSILFDAEADWATLFTLVTTKYHLHVPVSSSTVIVDVARGPGAGTLVVPGLLSAHALLTDLRRDRWVRNGRQIGAATFLITSIP